MKRITSQQALQFASILMAAALKTGLPRSEVQRLLGPDAKFLGDSFAELLEELVFRNPAKPLIIDVGVGGTLDDKLPSWQDQLEQMRVLYPSLSTDGIREQVEGSSSVLEMTFNSCGVQRKLWDNWAVFPLSGRVARKEGIGDLWKDLYKPPRRRQGIWSKLCSHMLKKINPLYEEIYVSFGGSPQNTLPNDFAPLKEVARWFLDMEMSIRGDFACVPCNLGSFCLGHAPIAAIWKMEKVCGIPCSAWVIGHMMAYHRLQLFPVESRLVSTGDWLVRRTGHEEPEEYASFFEVRSLQLNWLTSRMDEIVKNSMVPSIFAGGFDE